jgi:hypothetical protein
MVEKLKRGRENGWFFLLFDAFFLWNNKAVVVYTVVTGIPRPTQTQATRCENTFKQHPAYSLGSPPPFSD